MTGRGPTPSIPWPVAIATPAVFMLIGAVIIALIARSGRAFAPGAPPLTPTPPSAPPDNLPPACNNLSIGQKLLIPQPTPTPVPPSTATFTALESTRTSCELFPYTVQEGGKLGRIAAHFNVSTEGLKEFNQN